MATVPTTPKAIRDRIYTVIEALASLRSADDKFERYRNEGGADFRAWAESNPDACRRRFQVRRDGGIPSALVSNSDIDELFVTFIVSMAYPQTSRDGDAAAMDRDDTMDADLNAIEFAIGMCGRSNFSSSVVATYPDACWRDQEISDDEQMAFTKNFGDIENAEGGNITKEHELRLKRGMIDVSNLDRDGQPLQRDDRRRMFNLGNRLWHSDSSYRAIPAKYSLLTARIVASRGGNTEFADMRAAYDALDAETLALVEDLVCEHSLIYSRGSMGFTELTEIEREMFRPVRQRLVRTHPVTGRKSLFLASHIGSIVGWPVPEARDLIRDLTEHATQRQFVYVHIWRQHDLVMWDNRQTMHRVRRFDEGQPRDMRRTTVAGDAATVEQILTEGG